jgi:hypothetical protein
MHAYCNTRDAFIREIRRQCKRGVDSIKRSPIRGDV